MSDIKLFRLAGGSASEIKGSASDLEKPLQSLIENNLQALLGIRLLASEYSTGKTHAGRIDTLGIDENDCPVIIEYKRSTGENVINQGLFYLDWLLDHQAEFKLLTLEQLGKETASAIDWDSPRVLCIASDFTRYDAHAVHRIGASVELVRYPLQTLAGRDGRSRAAQGHRLPPRSPRRTAGAHSRGRARQPRDRR